MKLHFYNPEFDKLIENYTLTDEQLRFTGTPKDAIDLSNAERDRYSILAVENEQVVTFFSLHKGEGVKSFSHNDNAILIRSFSTDFHQQGKGYGKNALMLVPDLVTSHFIGIDEIVLAVNVNNEIAQSLYKNCGYIDKGVREMGRSGELIVMSYHLY
ncbi:GNAT family N-acetyltransferase [Sporosarcina sp. ANT_H38]|uniref:GNAT family N-acetyltransferase n=1 Tax=Sporosarcina sp. ANT_H38 TaxID=2597358 RepID=UPI0011F23BF5|nr:GNAT family protein [Sporosarcina sp. ANT_H38]KAA0965652.1 GNAT family N-acetyltransferase [Sporosarcina sp. ANT_H38]